MMILITFFSSGPLPALTRDSRKREETSLGYHSQPEERENKMRWNEKSRGNGCSRSITRNTPHRLRANEETRHVTGKKAPHQAAPRRARGLLQLCDCAIGAEAGERKFSSSIV
jgi:hypothetical protein